MIAKPVTEWLALTPLASDSDVVQLEGRSVQSQLDKLDEVGTGFGFVFTAVQVETDSSENPIANAAIYNPPELHVVSSAVFKMLGQWYVIADENVSDIACALVRMVMDDVKHRQ